MGEKFLILPLLLTLQILIVFVCVIYFLTRT